MDEKDFLVHLRSYYESHPFGELRQRQHAMAEMWLRYDERLTKWRHLTLKLERALRRFPMQRPLRELGIRVQDGGKMPKALLEWRNHIVGSPQYLALKEKGLEPKDKLIYPADPRLAANPVKYVQFVTRQHTEMMQQRLHFHTVLRFQKIDALEPLEPDFMDNRVKGFSLTRYWWRAWLPYPFWRLKDKIFYYISPYQWLKRLIAYEKRRHFNSQMGGFSGHRRAWLTEHERDMMERTRLRRLMLSGLMPATFKVIQPSPADADRPYFVMSKIDPMMRSLFSKFDKLFWNPSTTTPTGFLWRACVLYSFVCVTYYLINWRSVLEERKPSNRFKTVDLAGFDRIEEKEHYFEYKYSRGSFRLPDL